ncbi:hypothetical protein HJD18_04705 [Thermoleophilia bacterium SCSIO 60948]|nr:hypothetical protein HJD18_04705 [Thermoleophilia bacterium SCSIO 60948]
MTDERDSRWLEIASARDEFDGEVTLPRLRARDGSPRRPSQRALRLAEALSVQTSWTRISDARERRAA